MRVLAADTLAYLIEVHVASHIIASIVVQSEFKLFVQVSADLQRVAAISNHLISTMASYLRWEPEPPQVMKVCSSFIGRLYSFQFIAANICDKLPLAIDLLILEPHPSRRPITNIVCRLFFCKDHTRSRGVGCYCLFQ